MTVRRGRVPVRNQVIEPAPKNRRLRVVHLAAGTIAVPDRHRKSQVAAPAEAEQQPQGSGHRPLRLARHGEGLRVFVPCAQKATAARFQRLFKRARDKAG